VKLRRCEAWVETKYGSRPCKRSHGHRGEHKPEMLLSDEGAELSAALKQLSDAVRSAFTRKKRP